MMSNTDQKAMSPTSDEVAAHILKLQKQHPTLVSVQEAGRTHEGRPIHAVTLTDSRVEDQDKQHALIVAGQHGNEESSRLVALALMDWLVSREGEQTLARQKVVIMPNVSPDAAEGDLHETPQHIRPNLDHALTGPVSPEGKAVEAISWPLQPDLFVDMHACGGMGCSHDMVLYPMTLQYTEDENVLHEVAAEMVRAGEAAGIPHLSHSLSWSGWGGNDLNDSSTTVFHYRNFHSMVFLTETSEHNDIAFPAALRSRVGLARLQALLEYGNRRNRNHYYPGYPYGLMGLSHLCYVAVGRNAAERRLSRIALWKARPTLPGLRMSLPEHQRNKTVNFKFEQSVEFPFGIHLRCPRPMGLRSVQLDGRSLGPSETDGFYSWTDDCSTFVVVAQQRLETGAHRLDIEYE